MCLSVSTSAHPFPSANLLLFQDLLFSTHIQGFCLTTSVFWRNNFLVPAPKFPRKDFGGLSSPHFLSLRGRNGLDARMKIPWCMPVRLVTQLCLTLCDPMGGSLPDFSRGFSRQEYWSGLPCPPPGDLPNPGIEPRSPTLQADSLLSEPPGKPKISSLKFPNFKEQSHGASLGDHEEKEDKDQIVEALSTA